MKVTVLQLSPGHRRDDNLAAVRTLIDTAIASDGPDMIVLPEMWSCLGGDRRAKFEAADVLPPPGSRGEFASFHAALSDIAVSARIFLHAGSIGERSRDRLYNTTLVFGPDGQELVRYRKIHLFDVETASGHVYRESDTYAAGEAVATFAADKLVVGCAICYDLRFAALFSALRDRNVDLITLPSAFTAETGQAHWETLIRARAIETQCWVAAAATTGPHVNENGQTRYTHGHSMICDPWGTVVAQAGRGVGFATARIDAGLTSRIRREMPVWQHRVPL